MQPGELSAWGSVEVKERPREGALWCRPRLGGLHLPAGSAT